MGIKFEITYKGINGKGKHQKHYLIARRLEKDKVFGLTDQSRLNEVAIRNQLSQPRALDVEGKPRLDLFVFHIRHKKDADLLQVGQIVELFNE